MRNTSKILRFMIHTADMVEIAYKNSLFLKLCRKVSLVWLDSNFGKIISGFFSYEVHSNSLFFKSVKSITNKLAKSIAEFFSFKEAVKGSKYINTMNKLTSKNSFKRMHSVKTVFKNSLFINTIYKFWITVD